MEFFKGMPYVMEMLFYDHECVGIYELINLIKEYRKEMKQMISNVKEGDKHEQRN